MSDPKDKSLENRKFLHDLAGPMTVAKTMIRRALEGLNGTKPAEPLPKQVERLERALKALEAMQDLHADRKSKLFEDESA